MRILLDAGADPEPGSVAFIDSKGTPLMIAQQKGYTTIADMLGGAIEKKAPGETRKTAPEEPATPEIARGSDVDILPPARVSRKTVGYAIVIGIEQYRQKLPAADFASRDARSVSDYLTKVLGYAEENVVTLTNDRAALADFVKYFEKWLPNNVEQGSAVFVQSLE